MCAFCLCHSRILCRFALHWCDPPPCLARAGPSLLTPQVCLQPRQFHARLAASPPAGAQGLLPCPAFLRFKPQVNLAGMYPVLLRLSSPALITVRFRSRESRPNVQSLACALHRVPLKWILGSRPVAHQGMPGSHKPLPQGSSPNLRSVVGPLSSVMAPRPRTIFTEHLREASPAPSSSTGRRRNRSVREADVDTLGFVSPLPLEPYSRSLLMQDCWSRCAARPAQGLPTVQVRTIVLACAHTAT